MISPIKFGTDGWRGVIARDFTYDRVARVAPVAATVLAQNHSDTGTIVVGYDRRFMAREFARVAAEAVQNAGFDVLLSESYATTPAFSWAAHDRDCLGAIVLTASHNPAAYLGLKVKGGFGGSVSPEVTQQIELKLGEDLTVSDRKGTLTHFDPWENYCCDLRQKVDMPAISQAISSGKLKVFADVMHGAAAGGLSKLLELPVTEINSNADPLFDGGAPEPLPRYLSCLFRHIRSYSRESDGLAVGFVFDGDGDRIAAVDGDGNFLSSQILIPILIEHLAQRRGLKGEIVKTVSGSDLIPKIANLYNLPVHETPIGYKYIADRMLTEDVLMGGEESGGIGYNTHIPERDALLSVLYLLEAMMMSGQDLSQLYRNLQEKTSFFSQYDRIDLPLANMAVRSRLLEKLETDPPQEVAGQAIVDVSTKDGYKFRLADDRWLLIRFSGTEPVLRLYCEAADLERVHQTLNWAKNWADSI